jgi:5-(carboxyamino)imidazole ribonucleotide mutase
MNKALIEIRTGSDSDIPRIKEVYKFLESLGIPYSPRILSAHRTPQIMSREARELAKNGFLVSIAAAGGSAHLPGMTASETLLPVVGLPVLTSSLDGRDSLYSIIQMPNGIPVGTVATGAGKAAAILAAQIAYNNIPNMRNQIRGGRDIKRQLANDLKTRPMVGIIKGKGVIPDSEKYREMLALIKELGLKTEEFELSVDSKDLMNNLIELEEKGAMGVIVIAPISEKNDNYLAPYVSAITDLPTICLPIAEGLVASNEPFKAILYGREAKACPIACMGLNRYKNAALYASQIAGLFDSDVQDRVGSYRADLSAAVVKKDAKLQANGVSAFLKV